MKKLVAALALSVSLTGFAAMSNMANVNHEFTMNSEMASQVVTIKNPDVVAEAVNQTATEAFMQLDNNGSMTHKVVAATSPAAEVVQLHDTYKKNGQVFMHQVANITIKPHSDEDLKNGSLHVMLIDTHKQLASGQIVPITLIFDDGSWMTVNARVK